MLTNNLPKSGKCDFLFHILGRPQAFDSTGISRVCAHNRTIEYYSNDCTVSYSMDGKAIWKVCLYKCTANLCNDKNMSDPWMAP